jgi:ABC-type transport system involved in cytochrome bd biosynthesis fused ATPase/permease subunit
VISADLVRPHPAQRDLQRQAADQIIVLDGGRVAETGDHATLLARPGIYAELFTLQAEGYLGR